jgi:polysaccharide export outer membrane protein
MKLSFQRFFLLFALQMLVSPSPPGVHAQTSAQREILRLSGQEVSDEDILSQLAESGLTRAQVRVQLSSMGIDPSIADPYFDRVDGSGDEPLGQNADFLQALAELGAFNEPSAPIGAQQEVLAPVLGPIPGSILPIFGRSVFSGVTTEFQPVVSGPVDSDYTLGPGDQLQLILFGDVELVYPILNVTREGFILIPDVGQIFVNGLTLGDLTEQLYTRLGAVYSGVRRGADAATTFHVALGSLRSNLVFLVGDVTRPAGYQVSSVANVFNALYNAGGPGEQGSMRSIEVRRGGGLVAEVDLYDYLLGRDTSNGIRLEQNDRVFVPIVGPQVSIDGLVRRPAVYELKQGEQLRDLLTFAGGPRPDAYLRRIQIDRILPSAARTPGRERLLLDIDLETMPADEDFALFDGDRVTVLGIGDRRDNQVVVAGHVEKPGLFALVPNMTLGDVITRAGGLLPDAFEVAHLVRLVEADSTTVLERVSLGADGQPVSDVLLREMDRVVIFGRSELRTEAVISIGGEIKNPGVFPLNVGMTAEDLLLLAGGFTETADPLKAELVRRESGLVLEDLVAVSMDIVFDPSLPSSFDQLFDGVGLEPGPVLGRSARDIELRDGDRIFVRRLQGIRDEGDVVLSGEVLYPGPYALERRGENVSSLIARAGGLTSQAYPEGAQLVRDSLPVGISLVGALDRTDNIGLDFLLLPGDQLFVPQYDGTVQVIGAVEFQTRVRWREEFGLSDYIEQAGGVVTTGNRDSAVVTYANQERQRTGKVLFFFRNDPRIGPGSVISVPFKEPSTGEGFNANQLLAWTTSLVTLLVLVDQFQEP